MIADVIRDNSFGSAVDRSCTGFSPGVSGVGLPSKQIFLLLFVSICSAMRARSSTSRLPALLLSVALLMPVFPWAALRAPHAHEHGGSICHHMACPHQGQRCTCHGHEGTPLWQRCHDDSATPSGPSAMPYGPLPSAPVMIPPAFAAPTALSDATPPPLRPVTDIFHPPRRKPLA